MTNLTAKNLTLIENGAELVSDASFTLKAGEFVALLGPNGAGKTSLLRASLGLIKPDSGAAFLKGADVQTLSPAERARQMAYLPQTRPLAWPNRVKDIVALGRFAYGAAPGQLSGPDQVAIQSAIAACGLEDLVGRSAETLSGGELARVHIARAFAPEAPLLIADEPVAALDPRQQFRVLDLIKDQVAKGAGALVVLHDIGLAAKYADRLIWMKGGKILADGPTEDTLSRALLADVFNVRAEITGRHVEIIGAD